MDDSVLTDIRGDGVMVVTLNRPETLNSLGGDMGELLIEAVERASSDDTVRALIITGAGRGFCSGASAVAMVSRGETPPTPSRHSRADKASGSVRLAQAMADCDVPIIAAVNGAAAGAGCGIALCCDVRIFGESGRMGTIFIKRAVAADYGLSYWLPRVVGIAKAYELAYDGGLVDAKRALALGLANRVVPDAELMNEAIAYAATIAKGPPLAYTGIRRLLVASTTMPMQDFLPFEWAEQTKVLATADCAEGFRSFMERRDPVFRGE